MRLILTRALAGRGLLAAAAVAAAVTTTLLAGFALLVQLLPAAAVQAVILDAAPAERSLRMSVDAGRTPAELTERDRAVRQLLDGGLAGVPVAVTAGGYASGQELPEAVAPVAGSAVIGFLPELPDYAELVAGGWPEPGDELSLPAALPGTVAAELGLAVGDTIPVVDGRAGQGQPEPVTVELVGIWEPADPADPYWQLLAAPLERGGWGPFIVHSEEFVERYQVRSTLEWLAVPDPVQLAAAGPGALDTGLREFSAELAGLRDASPVLGSSLRASTELDALLRRLETATAVNRSGMVLPATLVAVIAGYGLVLVARLLSAHRRGENALLRARGASRRQLVRLTGAEALLVVTPGVLAGAPLGTALVRFVDRQSTTERLAIAADLLPYGWWGPPLAWLVAAGAGIGCAVALALPAAGRARTWVAEQQRQSRPDRTPGWQRTGVDIALVSLAVLAWLQLRRYGAETPPVDVGLGIDPLLVAAPVLGVLAATAVALRLLPLATRFGVRWAQRRDGFAGLLGMWQADRRPHAGPVLLLVLAVATAVLAPAVASTWQQSQRDQAAHAVGADLRVEVADAATASSDELRTIVPAATGQVPVHRTTLSLPELGRAPVLAIDSASAPRVAHLRPDLAPAPAEEMFARLREGRPELTGLPLPDRAARLTGQFRFEVPEPGRLQFVRPLQPGTLDSELEPVEQELPQPVPDRITVHVQGRDGTIRVAAANLPTGESSPGETRLDIPLPPDATTLVGLGGGLRVGGWEPGLLPDGEPDPVPVSWQLRDLTVVDAQGAAIPLDLPEHWDINQVGNHPAGLHREPGTELAVTTTLHPLTDYPGSSRFLLTAPPPRLGLIPLMVTPDVLAATGRDLGSSFQLTGGLGGISSARIAGVIDAVPGTPDGSGAMVDLAWLSTHQFLWQRTTPAVTEWWLAAPTGSAAAVAELGWAGQVREHQTEQAALLRDPLGTGILVALWAAAGAAVLLAGFGLVVDSRATAVQRRRELAVLHTLGAAPTRLARALVVEQAVLAGLGVAAGLLIGVGVAAAMAPSLVLTPAGQVPVPVPLLSLPAGQLAVPALGLLAAAVLLGAVVARRARREVAAGVLRIGSD